MMKEETFSEAVEWTYRTTGFVLIGQPFLFLSLGERPNALHPTLERKSFLAAAAQTA